MTYEMDDVNYPFGEFPGHDEPTVLTMLRNRRQLLASKAPPELRDEIEGHLRYVERMIAGAFEISDRECWRLINQVQRLKKQNARLREELAAVRCNLDSARCAARLLSPN